MQPLVYPVRTELLKRAWESFVETGRIEESLQETLDPVILRSWRRCAPRLDPRATPRPTVLETRALERVLLTF